VDKPTDRQTDKQTNATERPIHAGGYTAGYTAGVGNKAFTCTKWGVRGLGTVCQALCQQEVEGITNGFAVAQRLDFVVGFWDIW